MGAIGVAGFVALIVGAALTDGFDDDVSVHRLEVGDCVDLAGISGPSDEVDRLPRRDCDEPHDAEVFLIDDVAVDSDEYPGDTSLAAEIEEQCTGRAFEDYIGGTFADSSLDYFFLYPTRGVVGRRRSGLRVHGRRRRRLADRPIRSRGSGE